MDPTLKFVVFTAFAIASLLAGYAAGRRGWLSQAFSKRLHLFTIVLLWGPMNFLCVWTVPMSASLVWLAVFPVALIGVGVAVAWALGRAIGLERESVGLLVITSAVGNTGFSLGAYLCYCLLDDGQGAGGRALSMGVAMVTMMQIAAIPILYPVARHFSRTDPGASVWRLVARSFWDLRATPLYAGTAGLVVNAVGELGGGAWRAPAGVMDSWFVAVMIYAGTFGAVFGIGMNLRPAAAFGHAREHAALAMVKFTVFPAATLGLLWMTRRTAMPAEGLMADVLWVESFMPTALMSVMVANLFHLDAQKAAGMWLVNTGLFVVLALPTLVWLYG